MGKLVDCFFGVVNFGLFFRILAKSKNLSSKLRPNRAEHLELYEFFRDTYKNSNAKNNFGYIEGENSSINKCFSYYGSITSIFPLLGILGTVISFLKLSEITSEVITQNFANALSSTFFGLLFAILFKVLEGVLAHKIEDNNYIIDTMIKTASDRNEKKNDN
ncbi:MotA/TolQ/ExbB proton channel family protein [Petrotoga halophila]|uniref:MotA/TolQ/ExbB proton channel family protein n=1 Tax=Petrotoga halophila TaxID=301141 RepID=UPI000CDEFB1B|nr:MotA/TolQ/ExbB proton channel family protein [Petrotoga halophila]